MLTCGVNGRTTSRGELWVGLRALSHRTKMDAAKRSMCGYLTGQSMYTDGAIEQTYLRQFDDRTGSHLVGEQRLLRIFFTAFCFHIQFSFSSADNVFEHLVTFFRPYLHGSTSSTGNSSTW